MPLSEPVARGFTPNRPPSRTHSSPAYGRVKSGSGFAFVLSLLFLFLGSTHAHAQASFTEPASFDFTYYASPTGTTTDDGLSSGTAVTLQRALDLAYAKLKILRTNSTTERNNVKVVVLPGLYRQKASKDFDEANWSWFANSSIEPGTLVIEGQNTPGGGQTESVIRGSDDWSGGWTDEGGGTYSKAWTNDWGKTTAGDYMQPPHITQAESDLLLRRELAVVNGKMLRPTLNLAALSTGTFFVDEANDKIYLRPPEGTNMATATVEIGARSIALQIKRKHKLVVRNLVIEHDTSYLTEGGTFPGALTISGWSQYVPEQILVENIVSRWNGAHGLSLSTNKTTLRNVRLLSNAMAGGLLMGRYFLVEDCTAQYNNWRGQYSNYTGDIVAGIKCTSIYDATFRRFTSTYNDTKGLWLDVGSKNVTVEDSNLSFNRGGGGLFFEIFQGGGVVRNTTLSHNTWAGIESTEATDVTIDGCTIEGNSRAIHVDVGKSRTGTFTATDTGEVRSWADLRCTNWTVKNTTLSTFTSTNRFWNITGTGSDYSAFLSTLTAENNTYGGPTFKGFADASNTAAHFDTWRALSGKSGLLLDRGSTLKTTPVLAAGAASGKVEAQLWYELGGSYLSGTEDDRRVQTFTPGYRVYQATFEATPSVGNRYSQRLRGLLTAPVTGTYRFWITSKREAKLYIGTGASAATKALVASVPTQADTANYPAIRNYDAFPEQTGTVSLTAGQSYYIEALTNGTWDGHLSVAWQLPASDTRQALAREPIPSAYLSVDADAGTTTETLTITFNGDSPAGPNKEVIVVMETPSGATLGAPSSHSMLLLDPSVPTVTIAVQSDTAAEGPVGGSSTNGSFRITRTGGSGTGSSLSVNYSIGAPPKMA